MNRREDASADFARASPTIPPGSRSSTGLSTAHHERLYHRSTPRTSCKRTGCSLHVCTGVNGKNGELTTRLWCTPWRKLAEACNTYLTRGQVFVEGEPRGKASDGSQNRRIWQGNDVPARRRPAPGPLRGHSPYRQVLSPLSGAGKREGNGGAPIGEPPPEGYEDASLPF